MENNEKVILEGKFSYPKTTYCVVMAIIFAILALIQLIIVICLGQPIGYIWVVIFITGSIIMPFIGSNQKSLAESSRLTLYENHLEYRSSKKSFEFDYCNITKIDFNKNAIFINNKKAIIPWLSNIYEVYDVINSRMKGEIVETDVNCNKFVGNSPNSAAKDLKDLKDLFDAGLITEKDFEDKKAEILKRL